MRGTRRNKETFTVDIVENGHTREKHGGLVLYGVRMNIMVCYRLESKYPTT